MRFSVFAFSVIPDLDTARRNFDLHDLKDKDVAKVLYHQRKQQTGHSEELNWDQLQIASVSLVHYSLDYVEMGSHTVFEMDEAALIQKFYTALAFAGTVVSWDGKRFGLPLLNFRCMKHRISDPAYWNALREGQSVHLDLHGALASEHAETPGLEAISQRFFFPGMLGHSSERVWDAYLAGDSESLARYSDYRALNSYLLALEVLALHGEMSYSDAARARMKLRDYLENQVTLIDRYQPFLAAWETGA